MSSITNLPLELQNNIFYYYAEHPYAKMIKNKMLATFLKYHTMGVLNKTDRMNLRDCTINDTEVINTVFINTINDHYETALSFCEIDKVDIQQVQAK